MGSAVGFNSAKGTSTPLDSSKTAIVADITEFHPVISTFIRIKEFIQFVYIFRSHIFRSDFVHVYSSYI